MGIASLIQNVGDAGLVNDLLVHTADLFKQRIIKKCEDQIAMSRACQAAKKTRRRDGQLILKKYKRSSNVPLYTGNKPSSGVTGTFLDALADVSSDEEAV